MTALTPEECQVAIDAYEALGSGAATFLGLSRDQLLRRRRRAKELSLTPKEFGRLGEREVIDMDLPEEGQIKTYILTSAQSNTKVFDLQWKNLMALAKDRDATVLVGRMRYNITPWLVAGEKDNSRASQDSLWYASEIEPYQSDERLRLAPGLLWVGDMNCMPTSVNPLSGLDNFGGAESCIFPHTKVEQRSVSTHLTKEAKMLYTTGTVTLSNYLERKAGKKAEFNHAYAALIVEVDHDGVWFVRQLHADREGTIYDLDTRVRNGRISHGKFIDVMVGGDIHARNVDRAVFECVWGEGGFVDTHKPRTQVIHDLLDFESQSHHNSLFDRYELFIEGRSSVEDEVKETYDILKKIERKWADTYIVRANHDEHLDRWLREANFKHDMENAPFYLEAMAAKLRAIRDRSSGFNILEWALSQIGPVKSRFLARTESLEINGIELSQHFDVGANGARGSAAQFNKFGAKATGGHSHSCGIFGGAYQVGTFSKLDMDYVQGPSNWSHTFCVQYPNGKRSLVTIKNGKHRA